MRASKEKIEAELEELEAERRRRIEEKIEKGEAAYRIEFIGPDEQPDTSIRRDAMGREIFTSLTVCTGVPRGICEDSSNGTPPLAESSCASADLARSGKN